MTAKNERNAGRKAKLDIATVTALKKRRLAGESVTALAKEVGVSRQTLSDYLNRPDDSMDTPKRLYKQWIILNREFRNLNYENYSLRIEYMCNDDVCSIILVDFIHKKVVVHDETNIILHRAFGIKKKPTWEDFEYFLESRCLPRGRDHIQQILNSMGLDHYDPLAIIEKTEGRMAEDRQWIRLIAKEGYIHGI